MDVFHVFHMIVDGQETLSDTNNRFLDSQETADFRKVKEWL